MYAWPHGRLGYEPERVKRGRIGAYRFNKLLRSVLPIIENGVRQCRRHES
jgi:hypothetical protein